MIIVMKQHAGAEQVAAIEALLHDRGLGVHISEGAEATIIGIIGDKSKIADINPELLPGVEKCVPIMRSYKLASREFHPDASAITVGGESIGVQKLTMMAGPCAVESEEQILSAARAVKAAGATFLRGGAYKPRTSPYAFQGMQDDGYRMLRAAADETGLLVVSEVVDPSDLDTASQFCDMLQVGARNMQNFRLLREIGKSNIPVLLKRGIASTIDEWLDAAEHIMSGGNYNVVLCERGIRTFETATRNTLDISAIPVIKSSSHLPVIVDPSHAAGKNTYVESLALAAVAAGADGLIVEVHPNPPSAVSDAAQQLTFAQYESLCAKVAKVAAAVGRF